MTDRAQRVLALDERIAEIQGVIRGLSIERWRLWTELTPAEERSILGLQYRSDPHDDVTAVLDVPTADGS